MSQRDKFRKKLSNMRCLPGIYESKNINKAKICTQKFLDN